MQINVLKWKLGWYLLSLFRHHFNRSNFNFWVGARRPMKMFLENLILQYYVYLLTFKVRYFISHLAEKVSLKYQPNRQLLVQSQQ